MKNKVKYLNRILLLLILIPCIFLFTACGKTYITSIEKTESIGDTDVYTVSYSNGKTGSITVENGRMEELTTEKLFDYCVQQGMFKEDEFDKFLQVYVSTADDVDPNIHTNRALMSAVSVYSEFNYTSSGYLSVAGKKTDVSCGAGVIYSVGDMYSYIITNNHVIYNSDVGRQANEIHVYQYGVNNNVYRLVDESGNAKKDPKGYPIVVYDGGAVEATLVGGEACFDVAVLRVKTADLLSHNSNMRAVDVATNYSISDKAIAIGNPEGNGMSVTQGIISVESEDLEMEASDKAGVVRFRVMRIDTAVNGGNSGGGLFNDRGQFIGIVNAKTLYSSSDETPIENMAYALPYDNVIPVTDNIIYNYESNNGIAIGATRVTLGVTYNTQNSHPVYNTTTGELHIEDDLTIQSVTSDSIANFMGLDTGDIVRSLIIENEKGTHEYAITRSYMLPDLLLTLRPNYKIAVKYVDADTKTVNTSNVYTLAKSDFHIIQTLDYVIAN